MYQKQSSVTGSKVIENWVHEVTSKTPTKVCFDHSNVTSGYSWLLFEKDKWLELIKYVKVWGLEHKVYNGKFIISL